MLTLVYGIKTMLFAFVSTIVVLMLISYVYVHILITFIVLVEVTMYIE